MKIEVLKEISFLKKYLFLIFQKPGRRGRWPSPWLPSTSTTALNSTESWLRDQYTVAESTELSKYK